MFASMGQSKPERESLYSILRELQVDSLPRNKQDQLMNALGFEEDVAFAKSLFSDRIAQIYRDLDGQYEKFLARDSVAAASQENRRLLIAVFRRYHEGRLKTKVEQEQMPLKLPDPNKIEEVIAFQKKMYAIFKHLMPLQGQGNAQNAAIGFFPPHTPKFSPFAIFPQEKPIRMDSDFTPSLPPFLPFVQRPSADSLFDRQSFFSKHSFQLQRPGFAASPFFHEAPRQSLFQLGEDDPFPTKRLKRDESCPGNINFAPENLEIMRRELQFAKNNGRQATLQRSLSLQEPPLEQKDRRRSRSSEGEAGKDEEHEDE